MYPVVRVCELFPSLSDKILVSQLMFGVPRLSWRSARATVVTGGILCPRRRPLFFTAAEEDAILDAMNVCAAKGLLLTAETVRLLLRDHI